MLIIDACKLWFVNVYACSMNSLFLINVNAVACSFKCKNSYICIMTVDRCLGHEMTKHFVESLVKGMTSYRHSCSWSMSLSPILVEYGHEGTSTDVLSALPV